MHFLTLFSFFANNSRMKQPTPVFLSYMDFPYAIEGGSTKKIFWVLNKLYMAKQEAILRIKYNIILDGSSQTNLEIFLYLLLLFFSLFSSTK